MTLPSARASPGFHGAVAELDPDGSPGFHGRVLRAIEGVARYWRHRYLVEPEEQASELSAWLVEHPDQLRAWSTAERACLERAETPEAVEECEDQTRALVWTVFRNKIVDEIRRRHGRRPPADDQRPRVEFELLGPDELGREQLARGLVEPSAEDEYLATLVPALPGITGQEQELLTRRHVEGWSIEALAARFGTTPGAMRTRLARARAKVRATYPVTNADLRADVQVRGPVLGTQEKDKDDGTAFGPGARAA